MNKEIKDEPKSEEKSERQMILFLEDFEDMREISEDKSLIINDLIDITKDLSARCYQLLEKDITIGEFRDSLAEAEIEVNNIIISNSYVNDCEDETMDSIEDNACVEVGDTFTGSYCSCGDDEECCDCEDDEYEDDDYLDDEYTECSGCCDSCKSN